jgi:hypothetical protein
MMWRVFSIGMRWAATAAAVILFALVLTVGSTVFAPDARAADLPILAMSAVLVGAGLLFVVLVLPLLPASSAGASSASIAAVFVVGLAARLILFASEPILEVDYNRYLWDGGVVANGHSPYAVAPRNIGSLAYHDPRLALSQEAGAVFERISYPEFKTIYPPVAQAAFALAHLIEPWSLWSWRLVCLAADMATFALLIALLRAVGRSPLLVALYWWNPLVLKEIANSAHMEAVLVPLVLATLLLAARGRPVGATVMLGLAIGTKLWPVMIAPLVLRPLIGRPASLLTAIALLAVMCAAFGWLMAVGDAGHDSGLVAFASQWTTNSALFPLLQDTVGLMFGLPPDKSPMPGLVVRLVSAAIVVALALLLARRPIADAADLARRAFLVVSALVLLSPAQFPWYVLWVLPLSVLRPGMGWHLATALLPLYYAAFHFNVHGGAWIFESVVVWLIWIPVWLALAFDLRREQQPA